MNENALFFAETLQSRDPVIASEIALEMRRQQTQIELIASENIASAAVLEAQGTVLTNKYAEGYPSRRYYGGCDHVDRIEALAIDRACALFDANHANVQPHSGAQANGAVMLALVKPGDTVMGMSLDAGGHLTHGARPALSGKWFNAVQYGVSPDTLRIDYDDVRRLAQRHRPKLIIAGYSAYPRALDFAAFREIADSVGAKLMVDMAHIAGIVAAGRHQNPVPFADVVTSTTHKTLRGPRGGFILTNHADIAKQINSAVFPGLQGGPLMHVVAGKAVAFAEALRPEFTRYIDQVLRNAQTLAQVLVAGGLTLVTGGTDNHLLLVDLRARRITGMQAEKALERAGITCNKNGIPFDTANPTVTSGIRLGTPAGTTRGFGPAQFEQIGDMILAVLAALERNPDGDEAVERAVRTHVRDLCNQFPIYAHAEVFA
ncbi:serine hydroxymethyltransferase [Burkholderia multivorans]|uniref:Serine hydroxymethyltransferase n=1 Tax=Burkholderia multivorans CGD2 TaxID=513052 RepID=B9BUB4_9BURK|nr:serine hydroxymethyltransferase [Burkholderia multivorans]AJY15451.1 serine hydroxymethyltransferase 2 [Burkholderia multivorans ATCC BAA-247]AVR18354.1 serine hydroxymethyltransferase [Burkholderia multivorans]EEE05411.1 serine hydroxymethyltransferase [Burkholderia multivorans CGD2]EEE11683.1 serine hydroxymethyltransferase [Burkholderia multivorans CGD2M]EJO52996.1 glycine hydroxymethyltransferase [Burkholderia multivorans ATCC BAA-247]